MSRLSKDLTHCKKCNKCLKLVADLAEEPLPDAALDPAKLKSGQVAQFGDLAAYEAASEEYVIA